MNARTRSLPSTSQCWNEQMSLDTCLKLQVFENKCVIENFVFNKCVQKDRSYKESPIYLNMEKPLRSILFSMSNK